MRRLLLLAFLSSLASSPAWPGEWKNIRCACISSKTPSQKDYQIIHTLFPQAGRVQRVVFREKTYYILVKQQKIASVLSGWETGEINRSLWIVLSPQGQLLEVIHYPETERLDLRAQNILLTQPLPVQDTEWQEPLQRLQSDLGTRWQGFIRRVQLHIQKFDAITQATP